MSKRVCITGGCGFIGHFVAQRFLADGCEVVILDRLSYASRGLDRLRDAGILDKVTVLTADMSLPIPPGVAQEIGRVDAILHLGAESHVTRSIADPEPFIRSNVLGTMHLLNFARVWAKDAAFLYFSTDEVFGPARDEDCFEPWARYNSCNPYAATKAAGEELTLAYGNTYGLNVIVTHTMNCYGKRQHPEKFLPQCVGRILAGQEVVIHTDANGRSASRTWLHAANPADAVAFLVGRAPARSKWNISSPDEFTVLDIAERAAAILDKPLRVRKQPATDRPGNDARYAADGSRLFAAGWKAPMSFEEGFRETVLWYAEHPEWTGAST